MPTKKKSEKRQRNARITVRCSDEEKKILLEKAGQCSLPPSTYLRKTGLKKRIKTTLDSQVILELAKLRAEIGRLGGLVKAWLSPKQKDIGVTPESKQFLSNNKPDLKTLLEDLSTTASKIEEVVKKL